MTVVVPNLKENISKVAQGAICTTTEEDVLDTNESRFGGEEES